MGDCAEVDGREIVRLLILGPWLRVQRAHQRSRQSIKMRYPKIAPNIPRHSRNCAQAPVTSLLDGRLVAGSDAEFPPGIVLRCGSLTPLFPKLSPHSAVDVASSVAGNLTLFGQISLGKLCQTCRHSIRDDL